ncbi:MAG: DUF4363 family protein [Clostridia bacterium]|nr:DUF4363 family protein [Clostridia bacterium]
MFKETFICVIIIVFISVLDVYTQNYTKQSVNKMVDMLSELKTSIIDEDKDKINKETEQMEQEWQKMHDKLAYYIEHDELEKVDTAIVAMKSYVEEDDIPSAVSELEVGKFVMEHIQEKTKFSLQNIF